VLTLNATTEQELENQVNVHRWRKFEGSNPKAYEMIQLLQTLQKKLIDKTKEDDIKIKHITENEEMYLHCKALLANQVGPEAFEQVKEFERMLKDKQMQLRHMATELNMYQAQGKEYKHGIVKLDLEIANLKTKYIAEYYKNRKNSRENFNSIPNSALPRLPSQSDKFGETREGSARSHVDESGGDNHETIDHHDHETIEYHDKNVDVHNDLPMTQ